MFYLAILLLLCCATLSLASNIITVAGNGVPGYNGDSTINASNAQLTIPNNVFVDTFGNTFIADSGNHRVRKVDVNGKISTIAGTGTAGYNADNIDATLAQLSTPRSIFVDRFGIIYIADAVNQRVRKIDLNGKITTIAGTGTAGYNGDNIAATTAMLNYPYSVVVDSYGNIFIAEYRGDRVRKIDLNGIITTVAGTGLGGYNGDYIDSTTAQLRSPGGIAIDQYNTLYIADTDNHRVRKVYVNGTITTIAGTGIGGYNGDGIDATSASLYNPYNVFCDTNGTVFVADATNNRIRKIGLDGKITTIAGTGTASYNGDYIDATTADLNFPFGVFVEASGAVLISEFSGHRVRRVDLNGTITTRFGTGINGYNGDTVSALTASFNAPGSVFVTKAGVMYIADYSNHRVRRVDLNGSITTVAGTGTAGYNGDNIAAATARLTNPFCVFVDQNGILFIADYGNQRVRKVDLNGTITTVAGTGTAGFDSANNVSAITSRLYNPIAVSVDKNNVLYILENGNHRLRIVNQYGNISTIAGTGLSGYNGDGIDAINARLNSPAGVFVNTDGVIYIADLNNHRVRKIDLDGKIYTIAGTGTFGYNGDGIDATSAQLYYPQGVTVDQTGYIYIADKFNYRIRKIDLSGKISTFAGTGSYGYNGENIAATTAQLNNPIAIFSDQNCALYIADWSNQRVRKVINQQCDVISCFGVDSLHSSVCSTHGKCVANNTCSCKNGYTGDNCELAICYGILSNSTSVCSSHGTCQSPNNCVCSTGYFGNSCSDHSCEGVVYNSSSVCNAHGICISLNNCACFNGYTARSCDKPICFGKTIDSKLLCSNHGNCSSPNNCTCEQGYQGAECEITSCFGINSTNSNVCSGNGNCISPDSCVCNNGFSGTACEIAASNNPDSLTSSNSSLLGLLGLLGLIPLGLLLIVLIALIILIILFVTGKRKENKKNSNQNDITEMRELRV